MTALEEIIRAEIRAAGPMRFDRFMEMALYHPGSGYYAKVGGPSPIGRSGDFFTSVSVGPLFGRLLRDDDDLPGTPASNAVISEGVWRNAFGARRDIVGQPIRLAGSSLTIVGVVPSPFVGLYADQPADVWMPPENRSHYTLVLGWL